MKKDKKDMERPEAYPKPSSTDRQLQDQPEFLDTEANWRSEEMPVKSSNNNDAQETDERERNRGLRNE